LPTMIWRDCRRWISRHGRMDMVFRSLNSRVRACVTPIHSLKLRILREISTLAAGTHDISALRQCDYGFALEDWSFRPLSLTLALGPSLHGG
ncbi:hypothetical protein, partial [Rhizorhabdus argentea]|uniref:hypothetical protein n=1 Tax=Rhizorhabdus argentea TaxID=1387174 RepID=UPI0030EE499E